MDKNNDGWPELPANDNGTGENATRLLHRQQIDRVVSSIARLIGQQMAREDFEAERAANDNRARDLHDAEDRTDSE
ncbi:MAG: hypothetical protein C0457_02070 [Polymorphum sp.]|jgi:hypothetical protein|nr:hypothetical protein [Polymorphum sp.]